MVKTEKFENALDVDNEVNRFDKYLTTYMLFVPKYFHNQQVLMFNQYLPTCGNTVKQATYALGHISVSSHRFLH